MTTYNEDIFSDSYTPDPILPVAGDLLNGTLNFEEFGPDSLDSINLQLIAGHTYTFNMLAPPGTEFFYLPGEDAPAIYAEPVIDGPDYQLTFTALASGVYSLFVGSEFYVEYTIDVASIEAPVDPNIPTEGNDTVFGTDGADDVTLLGGDDRFLGGKGSDTVNGGDGEDHIFGQNGADYLIGGADDDKMAGGFGADTLEGGTGRDNLSGNAGNDLLSGGDGNDVLSGGGGQDTMNGGNNNDRMNGGGGNDVMNAGNGNDKMQGQNGNDYMAGGLGKDLIRGGNGEDTIVGGGGDDSLHGGSDADTFVFDFGMNRDVLFGFEDGLDLLDFSAAGITDISQLTLTQVGNHVVINLTAGDFVTVRNIDLADLTNDDFIFDDIFELG